MTRKVLAAAALFVGLLALALPAQAKGEGGKITIGGGGSGAGGGGAGGAGGTGGSGAGGSGGGAGAALLAKPIHIKGEGSAFWFEETGFGQTKFARPLSASGRPLTKAQLGPGLSVHASFLCGAGERRAINQVTYPYAVGGPQTYTPANQFMCGMDLVKGWWASGTYGQMFDTLVAHGLPKTLPAAFRHATAGPAATAASGNSTWPLILAGTVALTVVLLSSAIVQRRRLRLPA